MNVDSLIPKLHLGTLLPRDNVSSMSLHDLELAVQTLPAEDFRQFSAWFDEWRAEQWDRQIAEDADTGRLDAFYERLQKENEGQADVPLDVVLDKKELS